MKLQESAPETVMLHKDKTTLLRLDIWENAIAAETFISSSEFISLLIPQGSPPHALINKKHCPWSRVRIFKKIDREGGERKSWLHVLHKNLEIVETNPLLLTLPFFN